MPHAAQAPTRCACRSPENLWAACFARAELHLPSSRTKASGQGGRGSDIGDIGDIGDIDPKDMLVGGFNQPL